MPRQKIPHNYHFGSDEAAGAKIWSVYISQAEKYDKALVDNWRRDMEGILIFAGLFSASLTAFIIESYKTLSPDQGQITITLLTQISQRLAAGNNATSMDEPPLPTFSPTPISVVCNALWFISFALSLSAALVATLVEQWARNFLHKTDMRPSPIVRARVFSYLYYGMQKFHMHTVVEVVPLLLHASLFLFFSGLILFLLPINTIIATLVAGLLAVVTAVYASLTMLPILYPDCPYWTPLSGGVWRARAIIASLLASRHRLADITDDPGTGATKLPNTIVESMMACATVDSPPRTERDARAMCWTVKSLVDDDDLEPFLDGIPDLIHDSKNHQRHAYHGRITFLFNDPDIQLGSRMLNMIHNSDSGLLSPAAQSRRLTSCLKAIWAVASLGKKESSYPQPFDSYNESHMYSAFIHQNGSLRHYSVSAFALVRWSSLCSRMSGIRDALQLLKACDADIRHNRIPNISALVAHLKLLQPKWQYPDRLSADREYASAWINQTILEVQKMNQVEFKISDIYIRFLADCSQLDSLPYQFEATYSKFAGEISTPRESFLVTVEQIFEEILSTHSVNFGNPSLQDFDKLLGALFPLWQRFTSVESKFVPQLVSYMNTRACDDSIYHALRHCDKSLFARLGKPHPGVAETDMLIAMYRLLRAPRVPRMSCGHFEHSALDYLITVAASPVHCSVTALLQDDIIHSIGNLCDGPPMLLIVNGVLEHPWATHPLFPAESTAPTSDSWQMQSWKFVDQRRNEAWLVNVSQFLEHCCSPDIPYKACETLSTIASFEPKAAIHQSHQKRFARGLNSLISRPGVPLFQLIEELVASKLLAVYAQSTEEVESSLLFRLGYTQNLPVPFKYLDDLTACGIVIEALRLFARMSIAAGWQSSQKVQNIINALEAACNAEGGGESGSGAGLSH